MYNSIHRHNKPWKTLYSLTANEFYPNHTHNATNYLNISQKLPSLPVTSPTFMGATAQLKQERGLGPVSNTILTCHSSRALLVYWGNSLEQSQGS